MNITATIILLFFTGFIIWIIKYLEKALPQRDEEVRKKYKKELRRKELIKLNQQQQDLKVQRAVEEEEKKDVEIKQITKKENKKNMYKDNIRKGRDYELYITNYFKLQGYKIKPFGILHGKKDKGIDVIIMKNKVITLIQCKNWEAKTGYKINHKDLKEFLGNTTAFINNRENEAKGYEIKRMFVTSNDVLDSSAKHFLRENKIVEHKTIPIEI